MSNNHGGKRPGAGRLRQHIHLDKETARALSLLMKQRVAINPEITEEAIVTGLIDAAWQALDNHYQNA
jgi:hypothetical protein